MNKENFKKASRRLVIELAVVVLLIGYHMTFPTAGSSAQNWNFVFTQPLVLLHIAVGTLILVEAVTVLFRSIQIRNLSWMTETSIGALLALLAFIAGEHFVATQSHTALTLMTVGWFGAIVIYGVAWFLNRKKRVERENVAIQH
jgi:uncharacterized membrane protein